MPLEEGTDGLLLAQAQQEASSMGTQVQEQGQG